MYLMFLNVRLSVSSVHCTSQFSLKDSQAIIAQWVSCIYFALKKFSQHSAQSALSPFISKYVHCQPVSRLRASFINRELTYFLPPFVGNWPERTASPKCEVFISTFFLKLRIWEFSRTFDGFQKSSKFSVDSVKTF